VFISAHNKKEKRKLFRELHTRDEKLSQDIDAVKIISFWAEQSSDKRNFFASSSAFVEILFLRLSFANE
jgi:hypothetical protein